MVPNQEPLATKEWNDAKMRQHFPQFSYHFDENTQIVTWTGTLQPSESGTVYTVRITHDLRRRLKAPVVWVLSPKLADKAPHRYKEGCLCLHRPKDEHWRPGRFIAETIVPWTALWLFFYEAWLETGKWWGPEAPHDARRPK